MLRSEFISLCQTSGYADKELAEEYAGDRAIFSKEDVEEVFRKSELRRFLQNKWPRYAEEMGD